MARQLYSVRSLAAELCRDRRTVGEALRNVHPDGELKGRPAWFILTAVNAIFGKQAGARERKQSAEAALAELDLAERLGEVVRVEDVVRLITHEFAIVRDRVLAIPAHCASRVPAAVRNTVFETAQEEARRALKELSADMALKAGALKEINDAQHEEDEAA